MQAALALDQESRSSGRNPAEAEGFGATMLAAGDLRATLSPRDGGRIAALWLETAGVRRDILVPMRRPVADPLFWPKAGCYPLIPFSNRIRGGRFSNAGETVQLAAHPSCPPHALHGFAQTRPWRLVRHSEAAATMRYRHEPDGWPWAFEAEQNLSLDPAGLTVDMTVKNLADRPMPVGLGLHPYLAARPDDRIAFAVETEWEQDDAGCGVVARRLSPEAGRFDALHQARATTRYFAGWSGDAWIIRADGLVVTIQAAQPLDHFVFHVPADGVYACMEPVSHVADAFNLAAAGCEGTGFRVIDPGGEMRASIRIGISE